MNLFFWVWTGFVEFDDGGSILVFGGSICVCSY